MKVDPDTLAVIEKGLWMSERSRGAFDITVGVFKGLWKFDEDNDGSLPDPARGAAARRGWSTTRTCWSIARRAR